MLSAGTGVQAHPLAWVGCCHGFSGVFGWIRAVTGHELSVLLGYSHLGPLVRAAFVGPFVFALTGVSKLLAFSGNSLPCCPSGPEVPSQSAFSF